MSFVDQSSLSSSQQPNQQLHQSNQSHASFGLQQSTQQVQSQQQQQQDDQLLQRVQFLEKQVQSLLKVKSELESAVTEMCEDIRDKDEAVDKAAKIIEMLRTDLEKSVEDIIQSEQQRDHLKDLVKELERASQEQNDSREKSNGELQRLLDLKDEELISLKNQMKNLRVSYSNEIDQLRKQLHSQSRFTAVPIQKTKVSSKQQHSLVLPSPLASTIGGCGMSSSTINSLRMNKHARSASLTMSSKITVGSSPMSNSVVASPLKQQQQQQQSAVVNWLTPQASGFESRTESAYLMGQIEKMVEVETVEMKSNTSSEQLESLLDSFIVQIDSLSSSLAKEVKKNAALSELIREQQIVQRLTSRELNEQKALLEVATKMFSENVDVFESDFRVNTQMENESKQRRWSEMERLSKCVSWNSNSYFDLVLSVKAAVLLDEIERMLNEKIGNPMLSIPFSEKRKKKLLKQSEVELVLEAVIDLLNRGESSYKMPTAARRLSSSNSSSGNTLQGRDRFEGEPAEGGEALVEFLRNRIDALLEVFGFMEVEFESSKSRNKELEIQVLSLEALLTAATSQQSQQQQPQLLVLNEDESNSAVARRRLREANEKEAALLDENGRLHELIREQRVEIEHLSVKNDDEGMKYAMLHGEHSKAMALADQALLDLDAALRVKEVVERENAQLNLLVQEYQRLMQKSEDSSANVKQVQLEREVLVLREQLNEQSKVSSELRKQSVSFAAAAVANSNSYSSSSSECSSEFREVLLASIRCLSGSGMLQTRFPIPLQNLEILVESRPTLRTFVDALLAFQAQLSGFTNEIVGLFSERIPPESFTDFVTLIRRNVARIRSESESELTSLKRQVQEQVKQNQVRQEEFKRREESNLIERELQRTQVEMLQQQSQQHYQQTLRLQQQTQQNVQENQAKIKTVQTQKNAVASQSTQIDQVLPVVESSVSSSQPKTLKFKSPTSQSLASQQQSEAQNNQQQNQNNEQQNLNSATINVANSSSDPFESFLRFCRVLNNMAEQLIVLTNNRDNLLLERASLLPQSKNLMTAQFQLCLLNLLSNWKKSVLDTSNLFHQLSVYLKSLIANVQHPNSVFVPVLDVDSHVAILAKQSFFQDVMSKIEQLDEQNDKAFADSKSRSNKSQLLHSEVSGNSQMQQEYKGKEQRVHKPKDVLDKQSLIQGQKQQLNMPIQQQQQQQSSVKGNCQLERKNSMSQVVKEIDSSATLKFQNRQ